MINPMPSSEAPSQSATNSAQQPLEFATLPRLTPPDDTEPTLDKTFQNFASLLQGSSLTGKMQFLVQSKGKRLCWVVDLAGNESTSQPVPIENADVDVILHEDAWMQIARGLLSPAQAFLTGRMRIRGDVERGKKVVAHLSPGQRAAPC